MQPDPMSYNNLNKTKSEWMLNTKAKKHQDRFYSSKFKHSYLRTQNTRRRNLQQMTHTTIMANSPDAVMIRDIVPFGNQSQGNMGGGASTHYTGAGPFDTMNGSGAKWQKGTSTRDFSRLMSAASRAKYDAFTNG